jgi:hypothetical protein
MDSEVQPRLSLESQGGEKFTAAEDETTPCSLWHKASVEGCVPEAAVEELVFNAASVGAQLRTLTSQWNQRAVSSDLRPIRASMDSLESEEEVFIENDQTFGLQIALKPKFNNWAQCSLCDK